MLEIYKATLLSLVGDVVELDYDKPVLLSETKTEREAIIDQLQAADSRPADSDFDYEMPEPGF